MMINGLEAAISRAESELGRLRTVVQIVQGQPVEQWSIAAVIGILNPAIAFMGEVYVITKLETQTAADEIMSKLKTGWVDALEYVLQTDWLNEEITAVNRERLIQAKNFYGELLAMNYGTIGQVVMALNKQEVPLIVVADAAPTAYLLEPVRKAIKAGYGITPLEPQKKPI